MEAFSLRSRVIACAIWAGAAVFILALAADRVGGIELADAVNALMPAIVGALLCWAASSRALAHTSGAINATVRRLTDAADGDLQSPVPTQVHNRSPELATALDGLFRQLHEHIENVQRLAMFDPVTGLANRTNFRRTVERTLAGLPSDGTSALFFIDLDRFKVVNDTLGHACGDQLLAMVANRLRAVADRFGDPGTAESPTIGRLAGDEFTMFFPHLKGAADADRIGRGILYALGEPFDLADQEVAVGASIGIALRPEHGASLTDLMRAADAAMYHAKGSGRGRAEHFTVTLASEIAERAQLDADLRDALDRGEFALAFQPQLDLASRRVVAAEALLRWRRPSGETWPARNFIQRAEDSGLIVEIGDWTIAAVAQTLRRWAEAGFDHRLAVNISRRQLDHAHFFRRLRAAMFAAGAPARLLELEISETLAMHCSADVIDAIAALRGDGATIAIDGFGTGYSNLTRLRDLPVDRIKLDRSLIAGIAHDSGARTIVQAAIGLIQGLGFEAVGEGIETDAQAEVLRIVGCTIVQGFGVAPPMEEAAFLAWSDADPPRLTA